MSRPIIPNASHLHKVTTTSHGIPTQSQIPKKLNGDPPLNGSIVNSFLHSVSTRENPSAARSNGQAVFKTHQTLRLSTPSNETSTPSSLNQFGLRRANGSESAVQNRVRNLNRESLKNGVEEPESVVVYRTKTTADRSRVYTPPKAETPEKSFLTEDTKWKAKYEDAEKRRKELLSESQRLSREKASLEQKLKKAEEDYKQLKADFNDRTNRLNELRRVSEQVYQDYDKLNNKYETETTTLHKALEVASKVCIDMILPSYRVKDNVAQRWCRGTSEHYLNLKASRTGQTTLLDILMEWYKENKKLKRESVALRSSMMLPTNFEVKDETDGDDSQGQDELEELRKTVQDLSNQVGQLQSELNKARLQEFEAQEQYINLTQALDQERAHNEKMEQELKTLRLMKDKFESVTYMVHDEMKALRTERDRATEAASRLQAEAQKAQKERNVLAHQSSLLMGEISSNETLMKVLMEAEDLKRKLEEETQNHILDVQRLQEKLEFRETEAQLEVVEEKLRLAEEDLQIALQRAEKAEEAQKELEAKVSEFQSKLESNNTPAAPPLPPPPPPPPLPPMMPSGTLTFKKPEKSLRHRESIDDMANILGIQRVPKTNNINGGAINDIINEIKGGKFTLKATEKQKFKKEEPPPAVQEMLNIIGTLKRRNGRSKPVVPEVNV
ncbi:hypothetical protein RUM43_012584 [Polyplax serrata]|uniref:Shootin-1 n=1 Tax=Polyplax serrata TaxID=468196 RepID=A0AAN8Q2Y6_POLSC